MSTWGVGPFCVHGTRLHTRVSCRDRMVTRSAPKGSISPEGPSVQVGQGMGGADPWRSDHRVYSLFLPDSGRSESMVCLSRMDRSYGAAGGGSVNLVCHAQLHPFRMADRHHVATIPRAHLPLNSPWFACNSSNDLNQHMPNQAIRLRDQIKSHQWYRLPRHTL